MCFSAFCNWLWNPELKDGKDAKPGIGEVIALQGLLFAELGAMVGYIYVEHIPLEGSLLGIHAFAIAIPLGGMILMSFLRPHKGAKIPAHDRSTIMFLRWAIIPCIVVAGLITYGGWTGELSGIPDSVHLPIVFHKVTEWSKKGDHKVAKGDKIIEVYASLAAPHNNLRLPGNTLVVETSLPPSLIGDSWEILGTSPLFGGVASKKKAVFSRDENERLRQRIFIRDYDRTKYYTIKVILHQRNPTLKPEDVVKLIETDGVAGKSVLVITAYYLKQENQ